MGKIMKEDTLHTSKWLEEDEHWGYCNYYTDDYINILEFEINVKNVNQIKKVLDIDDKKAKIIRLHIILHELGHIACKHFNKKCDDVYESQQQEVEAWLYASKCLKNPESILETVFETSENADIFSTLSESLDVNI